MGNMGTRPATDTARTFVKTQIAKHPVVVFSKTYCPYCHKAKSALATCIQPSQYALFELDKMEDGREIQSALGELTGAKTVPRVFIGGQFIGGGDDTADKARTGELKQLLSGVGL